MKAGKAPKTVEDYFASIPKEARPALEKIRATIKAAAPPEATEKIAYQMPAFYYKGPLIGYASFSDHNSLFPMSVRVMEAHMEELKPYSKSKGTIRFPIEKPLPAALVRKLVKDRVKENDARAEARARKKSRR